jgi:hypothetical protein
MVLSLLKRVTPVRDPCYSSPVVAEAFTTITGRCAQRTTSSVTLPNKWAFSQERSCVPRPNQVAAQSLQDLQDVCGAGPVGHDYFRLHPKLASPHGISSGGERLQSLSIRGVFPAFEARQIYQAGDAIPLVLDGATVATVPVGELLP